MGQPPQPPMPGIPSETMWQRGRLRSIIHNNPVPASQGADSNPPGMNPLDTMAPGAEGPGAPGESPLSIPGLAGQGPPTMAPPAMDAMGNPIPALIIPVQDWQDHRLHVDVHNKYRKSQAFDQAPEYIKQLFAQHVQQHIDAIVRGSWHRCLRLLCSSYSNKVLILHLLLRIKRCNTTRLKPV